MGDFFHRPPDFSAACKAATAHVVLTNQAMLEKSNSGFAIGVDRSERAFRSFLPRKATPRDLYETTVIAKPP
jgi:hypothetical protein